MYRREFESIDLELITVIPDVVEGVLPSFWKVGSLYVCKGGEGGWEGGVVCLSIV